MAHNSRYFAAFLLAVLLLLPFHRSIGQGHEDWSHNLAIYEVNIRQYTPEGTFAAFSTHLDRLDSMGVGILWLMPVHPIGEQNRLGSLGSYYSVKDYLDVNPEFGTINDLKTLVQGAHTRGMYVILDWVANHTSWDNDLTTTHRDWYVTNQGQFIPPPGTNWSDVIELDYSKQGLRDYMIEAMKFWVEEVGVDGFRCDAVSFVPTDFWVEATTALVGTKPGIFMLAEGDGRQWHDAGFDMTFGWGLYGFGSGVLPRIAAGSNTGLHLAAYAGNENTTYGDGAYRMYFTSNHDENSWHGTPTELFGNAQQVFAVLTMTMRGMPLIYSGQEAGLNKRLAFFDKDQIPWRDDPYRELYTKLLRLKKANEALWNGARGGVPQRVLTTDNAAVYAFLREKNGDRIFVAANLTAQEQTVTLTGAAFVGTYVDVFSSQPMTLAAGAVLTLPAWGYAVYAVGDIDTGVDDEEAPGTLAAKSSSIATLEQNYPNPFVRTTRVKYVLSEPAQVTLTIVDVLGRQVMGTAPRLVRAGSHEVEIDAADLPVGVYFYRLRAADGFETRSFAIIR